MGWYQKFVDKTARKPSGWIGRILYRNPQPHYRSFHYVLEKLCLEPEDVLLDVCCGGGTLLKMALEKVNQAVGIDYSPDMLHLTRENNENAVTDRRLDLRFGDASVLPWQDNTFNAVSKCKCTYLYSQTAGSFSRSLARA